MRKFAVVVALLVLFGGMYASLWRPVANKSEAARAAAIRENAADEGTVRADSDPVEREVLVAAMSAESSSNLSPIKLVGSVVDEGGRPIEGALVTSGEARGTASADGEFELAVPNVGAIAFVEFEASASEHERVRRRIHRRAGDPELVDLGQIVLRAGGEVSGVVVDAHGRPLALAPLSVDGELEVRASVDGRFRFEHVAMGAHRLLVAGFTPSQVAHPFTLEAGSGLDLGTVEIACEGFLAGRIESGDGAPIASARVEDRGGWSRRGAMPVSSELDGWFWLPLFDPPAALRVQSPGFSVYDDEELGLERANSAADIRIVLRPIPRAEFVVLDAATRTAVERFALWLQPGSLVDDASRIGTHPQGALELARDPADREFVVIAPGYAPQVGVLAGPSEEPQIVLLRPGGSVTGRIVAASSNGARVSIEPASQGASTDVPDALVRMRIVQCEKDGSFLVEDLAPGTYQLVGRTNDGSQGVVERVRVAAGERADVGEIRLVAGATLKGRVLLPDPASGENVFLTATASGRARTEMLAADGSFEVRGLAAGPCELRIAAMTGVLPGVIQHLELAPGETRELLLDLRNRKPSKLTVWIRTNGEPSRGVVSIDLPGAIPISFRSDENGRASNEIDLSGPARIKVATESGLPLAVREVTLDSSDVDLDVDVDVGELAVTLTPPDEPWTAANLGFVLPETGDFHSTVQLQDLESFIELGPIAVGPYTLRATFIDTSGGNFRFVGVASREIEIRRGERTVASLDAPRAR